MAENSGSDDLSRPIKIDGISSSSNDGGDYKTLYGVVRGIVADIGSDSPAPLVKRIKKSVWKNAPYLREASRNSVNDLLRWTREGSALRALLVISVGTITLVALTGLSVFMLLFLSATLNAVIISAFMSLAAAGGFLALFFACVATIYIGALSIALFVISVATISTIIAVIVATGWIGFFCVVWVAIKKSMDLMRKSVGITSSAISAYSTSRKPNYDASLKSPLVVNS